jgi:NAD(P)-dependent dehydrogenase (short-subunit alcohol dehydrogenase family)
MAKILVVGANGTIGHAVADLLENQYAVIRVGHSRGEHTVDLGDKASIAALFDTIGGCDAVVCAAGLSRFAGIAAASDDDFAVSIGHKLMGQVNLARIAVKHLPATGSITLTTGLLAREPMAGTAPTAMVNAGLEGFVRAAALDLADGIRINAVSPIFVTQTAVAMGMGETGTMPASETAKAYQAAVAGDMTGRVLDVREYGEVI